MNLESKIVIWGYPMGSHTHSFVHSSWFKAFKHLGFQVYWFDDNNIPENFNWDNCIFITEGYCDGRIPLNKTSTYYVHVCHNPSKYLGNVGKLIDMRYYIDYQNDFNYNYKLDKSKLEMLGPLCGYEPATPERLYECIYISWATDLLPHEINYNPIEKENRYYHIGTLTPQGICENYSTFAPFIKACQQNQIEFIHSDPWRQSLSFEDARFLTQKSYMSADIRGPLHLSMGYIPCRVFKAMSYGQVGLTNSKAVYEGLDRIPLFSENTEELFYLGQKNRLDENIIKRQMEYVKKYHTYLNRIESILKIL